MTHRLQGRTIVMSGGSRGIGLAILVAAARQGANAVLLAKTDQPDPRLPGTVHTAVEEIEAAGGKAVAVVGDVRKEEDVERAVATAVETFGGVDVCVNNASAINVSGTEELPVKRFDLMQQINARGTYVLTRACLPHLRKSDQAHVLTLSPPLNLAPHWLGRHPGYTLSKYGMTLLTLGWAAEYSEASVAANCLWPRTTIATAAVINLFGDKAGSSRSPEIMADAAVEILAKPSAEQTGRTLIDEDVLRASGVTDFSRYGGGEAPDLDIYVDPS
ncbi:SDR family oxidoreductase [Pseudonocardia kunmingensis]|uniref:NAD(P)-dependent dehydrogenase (Short-subunit alcohol dehydrogenase family) n=1 Tax=Pseudonocardia kunmingensis TaxID=630975 RepID=A0A543DPX4_9PSEU|nr:NAD(P)-dependent oxidoreductase [Pseudonocardia kunmingensis]TQM11387.1 NAD(P)-dependent dehydrogenase (short-subunit alcohol dehydrogenase family) [Pseudonocardia kunmingensis]